MKKKKAYPTRTLRSREITYNLSSKVVDEVLISEEEEISSSYDDTVVDSQDDIYKHVGSSDSEVELTLIDSQRVLIGQGSGLNGDLTEINQSQNFNQIF
jgi:hypothetical protein